MAFGTKTLSHHVARNTLGMRIDIPIPSIQMPTNERSRDDPPSPPPQPPPSPVNWARPDSAIFPGAPLSDLISEPFFSVEY